METNVRLRLVLSTLDGLTVTGRDNMERVVASCQEIERIIDVTEKPTVLQESGTAKQLTGQEETNG